jgi:RimJ/RimL family protein N-acetyltransferase
VSLEPIRADTVDLVVRWTLDPIAQGRFKVVPVLAPSALREQLLASDDRRYFVIRRVSDDVALGRFYWRVWHFHADVELVDWELNILIADPNLRGRGYGSAAQQLATEYLLSLPETHTVFAYTHQDNAAERRALARVGFQSLGPLPHGYYRVPDPGMPCIVYARKPTMPVGAAQE